MSNRSEVLTSSVTTSQKREGIYHKLQKRRYKLIVLSFAVLVVVMLLDISTGASWIGLYDVLEALFGGPNGEALSTTIVWYLRLPVTLTCLVVGASLGLAGGLMQTLLANPLASPYTLGISAAAGFGAAMALLTGFSVLGLTWLGVPIAAFTTSALASMAIYFIGRSQNMEAKVLILAGIVVLFFFQALQSLL